jgi:PPOX class probable FMN-dependent enzyme
VTGGPGWDDRIADQAALRALYPAPTGVAAHKHVQRLDEHCRAFIGWTTLAVLATSDALGGCDASPRGGPPGFIRVHDELHLLMPDAPGNRRVDSFANLLVNPRLGMVLFVPRYGEVLRIEGRGWLTRDAGLRAACETGGKPPQAVLVVRVEDAFLHCAKAVRRSGLWEPESWAEPAGLASAARIWRDHTGGACGPEETIRQLVEESYTRRVW